MSWVFEKLEHGSVKKLRLRRRACGDVGTGSPCFYLRDKKLLADPVAGGIRAASRQRRKRPALEDGLSVNSGWSPPHVAQHCADTLAQRRKTFFFARQE